MSRKSLATADCPPDAAFADFVEGRLAAPETARLTRHVEGCAACRELVEVLRPGARVEGGTAPPSTGDAVVRAILRSPGAAGGDLVGATIDRKYRLSRLLGEGGMGSVYEASHVATRRRVAVKLIHARLLGAGDEVRRRFQRESRAASAIDSPHVVAVLDAGEDLATGNLYLVMELLPGEDLQHLIDRVGPLRPEAALRVAAQALVGLSRAHAVGIVHRDIKPANLFLVRGPEGEVTVKLLDFGIAKVTAQGLLTGPVTALTDTGGLLGSPLYMSPEQVQSSKDVDHRTDLWSLGSVLYSMLAGQAPFRHVESVGKLILAICGSAPPPLRSLAPWVAPEVAAVVERALAKDPGQRWPDAASMLGAIAAQSGGLALYPDLLSGVPPSERETRGRAPSSRGVGRSVAAGALLAVAVVAVLSLVPDRGAHAPASPAAVAPPPPASSSSLPAATAPAPVRAPAAVSVPPDAGAEPSATPPARAVPRPGARRPAVEPPGEPHPLF